MGRGRLWLVVVLLGTGTLAEEDLERDILTEDEEGVVEEDMSLYTRLLIQRQSNPDAEFVPGTEPSCTEC